MPPVMNYIYPFPSEELIKAVQKLKTKKAVDTDNVSNEVLKCEKLRNVLLSLFNSCFLSGYVPSLWKQGIIKPIP